MSNLVGSILRNTYVSIDKSNLNNNNLNSTLFIAGNDLPRYIKENRYKIFDNDIISIIDPNLNSLYWDNRELLSITDLENLTDYMKQASIEFIRLDTDSLNTQMYVLNDIDNDNDIDYNILYITVKDFIKAINSNNSIVTKSPKADINIELQYELYDFYNNVTQKIDNFISR